MSELFKVSVVMPVWREEASIEVALTALQALREQGHEVIVVDGGSDDRTVALATPLCDRLVVSAPGRALQMNAGAGCAQGEVLLFLHADTRLPPSVIPHLEKIRSGRRVWGRFDVRLSGQRSMFRVISGFMNLRSRLTGIATGDQAMFVRRDVFEALNGFAPIALMEDVELSSRLRLVSRPYCAPDPVITDSRRWEQHGTWRTIFLMWRLRWRYWRGESPDSLAKAYRSDVRN
ncbi:TIGR04283 family arsenosugar biosynthesis glycosyltransferase [Marinobacter zhejiangensis]|uniref:TIGR04283 family arsenosugar biosynthesis glycosyltransferase n=1 Tax=Marinobacter zhejiangensis TaxID=488535 RepID=UPI001FE08E98|nr:TIGR04283 family arsenosugar biosynthesis glycosyltransferase [Marinobacter zhejiangensis]